MIRGRATDEGTDLNSHLLPFGGHINLLVINFNGGYLPDVNIFFGGYAERTSHLYGHGKTRNHMKMHI
jgi:hypothetical protein